MFCLSTCITANTQSMWVVNTLTLGGEGRQCRSCHHCDWGNQHAFDFVVKSASTKCFTARYFTKWSYDLRSYERNFYNCVEKPEKFIPLRNESMMKWYMKWIIYELRIWNQVKLWSSQLWTDFYNLLLYAIVKIAFITAKIIASLDFISAVHIWFISYTISSRYFTYYIIMEFNMKGNLRLLSNRLDATENTLALFEFSPVSAVWRSVSSSIEWQWRILIVCNTYKEKKVLLCKKTWEMFIHGKQTCSATD